MHSVSDYEGFLERKRIVSEPVGFDIQAEDIHPAIFPFQRDITRWAVRRGRAAIFADPAMTEAVVVRRHRLHPRHHRTSVRFCRRHAHVGDRLQIVEHSAVIARLRSIFFHQALIH